MNKNNNTANNKIPIKSWCFDLEDQAMLQAKNLSEHPVTCHHIALMPDCHVGYGMPIGGVIACKNAVIPNAVGVDIGCGMIAVETNIDSNIFQDIRRRRELLSYVKKFIPLGEGNSHKQEQKWNGFDEYLNSTQYTASCKWPNTLDRKNLGTLGGGNHFIELQRSNDNKIWLMIHSGSRNLGYKIAAYYHKLAIDLNIKYKIILASKDLAFLPADSKEGISYLNDMNFALEYALENRYRMMNIFKVCLNNFVKEKFNFIQEINIHHNYASLEKHFNQEYWIHRKGATSAKKGEIGIIPGSMGTPSYIIKGKGNPESFMSCSHGAGRCLGRRQASANLTLDECNKAMEGIAFDKWKKVTSRWQKKDNNKYDLSEAPQAYKNINNVIKAQLDLIEPQVKLFPLGVLKG